MTFRTPSAATIAALMLAIVGCQPPPDARRCGAAGIAGLPPPAPVWTHASADSIYYAPRGADSTATASSKS